MKRLGWAGWLIGTLAAAAFAADSTTTAPPAARPAVAPAPAKAGGGGAPAAAKAARAAAKTATSPVTKVKLRMRHRVHAQFMEEAEVGLRQDFPIGDTEYSGRILRYVPDFTMDKGKVSSRSNEPRNPAFQIVVKENGAPHDTSWAFMNFPPHFSRKSILAFQVMRIDFSGRPSMHAKADTLKGGGGGHP
jgi:hypothetical protein